MDINDIIKNLSKNISFLGIDPKELENEDFSCSKSVKYSIFKEMIILGNNYDLNEVIIEINSKKNTIKQKILLNFVENINKLLLYCSSKKVEYTEIKINLDKMELHLDEINGKRDFDFLSLDNFKLIKDSFYEGDPLVEDLFLNLSNLDLSQLCKIKQEISIENKIF